MTSRVWVTRSQPGAGRQAAALEAAGYEVLIAPVIEIEPCDAVQPASGFQHVIFLSEHAVVHGGTLDYCKGAVVWAVGMRTAETLAPRGIEARVPDEASSEGLLRGIGEESLQGAAVLIVAGEGGRNVLGPRLSEQGASVEEYLCYRRVPFVGVVDCLEDVGTVLVASQDGFRHVARLWFESGGCAEVRIIAASQRIAEIATDLGFHNVQIARGATTRDWITALEDRRGHQ